MISKPVGISALVIASLLGLGAVGLVATNVPKLVDDKAPAPVGGKAVRIPLSAQPESPVPAAPPNPPSPSPSVASPSVVVEDAAPPPQPVTAPLGQPAAVAQSNATFEASSSSPASTQRLNLNNADVRDLRKLPQVTRSRARTIVKGRPYRSVSDLINRKLIPKKTFAAIKDLVEVR